MRPAAHGPERCTTTTSTSSGPLEGALGVALLVVVLLLPVATAVFLARRAGRRGPIDG